MLVLLASGDVNHGSQTSPSSEWRITRPAPGPHRCQGSHQGRSHLGYTGALVTPQSDDWLKILLNTSNENVDFNFNLIFVYVDFA